MKPAENYQPDVAAYYIGRFVQDYARDAIENSTKPAGERTRPWKVDGARLVDALTALRAEAKNPYVEKVVDKCLPVAAAMEQGKTPDPAPLGDWLSNNAEPRGKELFKGVADSTVKEKAQE